MDNSTLSVLIFTDLDGCLLSKIDYDWQPANSALRRIHRLKIPIILSSSKTASEMKQLASELPINEAPFIAENGGYVYWPESDDSNSSVRHDSTRSKILNLLSELKPLYRFRSFRDLGTDGVMTATDLPIDKARRAIDRFSTEPLLWDDSDAALAEFRKHLLANSFSLTKGGRFWHVAGTTTKGMAMQQVIKRFRQQGIQNIVTLGIGDSPIDQSMLDVADYPIGIPAVDGRLYVSVGERHGTTASFPGPSGWAEAVNKILDQLNFQC